MRGFIQTGGEGEEREGVGGGGSSSEVQLERLSRKLTEAQSGSD